MAIRRCSRCSAARAAVGRMCPIRGAGGAVYRRAGSSGSSSRPRLAEPAEPGVAGPLPLRERGGLDAAAAAESAVAGTEDDVDAAAGDARAAGVTRASAVARAAGARAVAAEEVGAPANAEEEYSEPDLAPTGFQQSVDQKKKTVTGATRAVSGPCSFGVIRGTRCVRITMPEARRTQGAARGYKRRGGQIGNGIATSPTGGSQTT